MTCLFGMRCVLMLALAACESSVALTTPVAPTPVAPTPVANPAGGYLRFNLTPTTDNRIAFKTGTWVDASGRDVWTRPMPGRLGRLTACCWDDKSDAYLRDPQGNADYVYSEAPLVLADVLVIEQEAQVWVLALSDGHTVFDWSDNRTFDQGDSDPIVVDHGELTIKIDGQTCSSKLPYHSFVRACGDKLVYFDQGQLALFSRDPWKLLDVRPIEGTGQRCGKERQPVDRTENISRASVRWIGERITMCIH